MSVLALPKHYGDLALLYAQYIHEMWDTLEAKVNGNIDKDNLQTGFANWSQVTLVKDVNFYMGAAGGAFFHMDTVTGELIYTHAQVGKSTIFKINAVEVARVDSAKNLSFKKEIYFPSDTSYGLFALIARYTKPLLVYTNSTTIDMENNTEFANESLVVLPYGPIHVQEDLAATQKFRRLVISNTANGYASGHVGAAQGGVKVGLVLTANTWYFVYAVRVQFGADAGNKFIMVLDSTSPKYSNFSTLDTRYGSGQWVYLGSVRYGMGGAATTTLAPFVMDKSGWTYFTGRAAASDYFGIRVVSATTVNSTTYTNMLTFSAADSGNACPDTVSSILVKWAAVQDGDSDMSGTLAIGKSTTNIQHQLESLGDLYENTDHGGDCKIPNNQAMMFLAKKHSSEDFSLRVFISGFLDEFV